MRRYSRPPEGRLESLQVGLPREWPDDAMRDRSRVGTTGFFKSPVAGPVWVGSLNLQGDGQADLVHHGGSNKAVCVYSADHFPYWRAVLNGLDLQAGAFGENFTIAGLIERDVCIGDTWQVGQVLLQVSQPRQPCWKLARRWDVKDLALHVQQSGRTGWYFRVIQEGVVASGWPITLVERPHAEWTIEAANRIMHHDVTNLGQAERLAAVPPLSSNWRETLHKRFRHEAQTDSRKRLDGSE